jgi:hypothetical protein
MARQLRLEFAGALYHVTARGNARQAMYADVRIAPGLWTCSRGRLPNNGGPATRTV